MSKSLTIVAKILVHEEHRELVKSELLNLIETTRNEAGCIQYDLHQDHENPNLFLFFENWTSRELWQAHMNNDHINAYRKKVEGCVADFELFEMTQIG